MKKILFVFLALTLIASFNFAQKTIKVKDVKQRVNSLKNEVVVVEGFVTQYIEGNAQTTAKYYIKGDWGGIISVRTATQPPIVGKKYRIKGIVDLDPAFNEPFITEIEKTLIEPGYEGVQSSNENVQDVQTDETSQSNNILLYALIAGAVIVLIVLIIIIVSINKKKEVPEYVTPVPSSSTNLPEPERVVEGSTIKMQAPPQGTLKMAPGRLKVVSGDDSVKEIRFYQIPGESEVYLTFGRAAGKPYSHIQLKPMTVSSKQAKILFKDGKFILTNYSKTNPTVVNGVSIDSDSSIELKDGDKIEMGEVIFEFSEK